MIKIIILNIVIILLVLVNQAQAQYYNLIIRSIDEPEKVENVTFKLQSEINGFLKDKITNLQEQGYLAASLDSVLINDSSTLAWIHIGEKYNWIKLSLDSIPKSILHDLHISQNTWVQKPISPRAYSKIVRQLLKFCAENGYPFARVFLNNQYKTNKGIEAELILDRGSLIRIDTIIVHGEIELANSFLYNQINIKPGDLYDERKFQLIEKRISELLFIQQDLPWKFEFTIGQNKLYLYLKEKKANQLNGLLGLQPNSEETGKFLLTADFLLALKNSLGYAEEIDVSFQNLQYQSPRFKAHTYVPYFLGTKIGPEFNFELYKKDTTYRTTAFEGGLRYSFTTNDFIKLSYQHTSSRLINPDTGFVLMNKQLPELIDYTADGLIMDIVLDRTDFKFNPSKGWHTKFSMNILKRHIIENSAINELSDPSNFNFASLYQGINDDPFQYRITGEINYYLKLFKNFVSAISYTGGLIESKQLFQNELFQLGGFQSLRGFDEQSIYSNQFHILSLELRFLISTYSYFYLFSDNAYTQTYFSDIKQENYPLGLGGGLNLENDNGAFNIAIGIGKNQNNAFEFRKAKIHFGYVAFF